METHEKLIGTKKSSQNFSTPIEITPLVSKNQIEKTMKTQSKLIGAQKTALTLPNPAEIDPLVNKNQKPRFLKNAFKSKKVIIGVALSLILAIAVTTSAILISRSKVSETSISSDLVIKEHHHNAGLTVAENTAIERMITLANGICPSIEYREVTLAQRRAQALKGRAVVNDVKTVQTRVKSVSTKARQIKTLSSSTNTFIANTGIPTFYPPAQKFNLKIKDVEKYAANVETRSGSVANKLGIFVNGSESVLSFWEAASDKRISTSVDISCGFASAISGAFGRQLTPRGLTKREVSLARNLSKRDHCIPKVGEIVDALNFVFESLTTLKPFFTAMNDVSTILDGISLTGLIDVLSIIDTLLSPFAELAAIINREILIPLKQLLDRQFCYTDVFKAYIAERIAVNCPSGYTVDGSSCVNKVLPSCQSGYGLVLGTCTKAQTCPDGYGFNPFTVKCERTVDSTCPSGYALYFGNCGKNCFITCEFRADLTCPGGFQRSGERCLSQVDPCPSGTTYSLLSCVYAASCPAGYVKNLIGECIKTVDATCGADYTLSGGAFGACYRKCADNFKPNLVLGATDYGYCVPAADTCTSVSDLLNKVITAVENFVKPIVDFLNSLIKPIVDAITAELEKIFDSLLAGVFSLAAPQFTDITLPSIPKINIDGIYLYNPCLQMQRVEYCLPIGILISMENFCGAIPTSVRLALEEPEAGSLPAGTFRKEFNTAVASYRLFLDGKLYICKSECSLNNWTLLSSTVGDLFISTSSTIDYLALSISGVWRFGSMTKTVADYAALVTNLKTFSPVPVGRPSGTIIKEIQGSVARYIHTGTTIWACQGTCAFSVWFHILDGMVSLSVSQVAGKDTLFYTNSVAYSYTNEVTTGNFIDIAGNWRAFQGRSVLSTGGIALPTGTIRKQFDTSVGSYRYFTDDNIYICKSSCISNNWALFTKANNIFLSSAGSIDYLALQVNNVWRYGSMTSSVTAYSSFISGMPSFDPVPVGRPSGTVISEIQGSVARYLHTGTTIWACQGTCAFSVWFQILNGMASLRVAQFAGVDTLFYSNVVGSSYNNQVSKGNFIDIAGNWRAFQGRSRAV